MRARLLSISLVLVLAGCSSNTTGASVEGATEAPAEAAEVAHAEAVEAVPAEAVPAEAVPAEAVPAETAPNQDQTFGEALAVNDVTSLADIAGEPTRFAGQVVRTTGEIASVCQRMGCWMEIRAEGVEAIRVPMAGHSFFLPRDVAGRRATVEGVVSVRELPQDEREHLEGEGATATAQPIQIAATGVIVHAS